MTVLWGSLIVVGVAMIAVALWPSIRGGKDSRKDSTASEETDRDGF